MIVEPSPDVDEMRALLARCAADWDRVLETTHRVSRDLRIADVDVRVTIGGEELARMLLPPFDGLAPAAGPPVATVGAWDADATGVPFAPRPPIGRDGPYTCVMRRDGRPVAELEWESSDLLRTGDRDVACHLMAVTSASVLPLWEAGAPLRRQLSWALGPEVLFVHAAAVGSADGAALIIGPSGSGKSSTALACLRAGMGFLSDDFCLVRGDPPVVHRLHATARLHDEDVRHVDDFVEPAVSGASLREFDPGAKALFLLYESRREQIVSSAPVRAVVVPQRGGGHGPGLELLRPAEALRLVAPHALWQMSLEPDVELAGLRRLLMAVPAFRLRLSDDRSANPALVQQALDRAARDGGNPSPA
jgi:hypothetical protein